MEPLQTGTQLCYRPAAAVQKIRARIQQQVRARLLLKASIHQQQLLKAKEELLQAKEEKARQAKELLAEKVARIQQQAARTQHLARLSALCYERARSCKNVGLSMFLNGGQNIELQEARRLKKNLGVLQAAWEQVGVVG